MTIVCATDFSPHAVHAGAIAARMAMRRSEPLLLVHAVQPELGDTGDPWLDPVRRAAESRLSEQASTLRERGVKVEEKTLIGWPDELLLERLPHDTSIIVIGSRGHSRGTHWAIGSFAERLARVSQVPLLVVRDSSRLDAWLTGSRPLRITVATDLTPTSTLALDRAASLEDLGPCNVELLYVECLMDEYARLGISGPVFTRDPVPAVDDVLSRELEKQARAARFRTPVARRIARTVGNTGAYIADDTERSGADLVVVGTHQRTTLSRLWHGSVAHGVLHAARTNVLCVPFHTPDESRRALERPAVSVLLAATDFTPAGNRAVAWAATIAKPGTKIVVVSAVELPAEREKRRQELDSLVHDLSVDPGCRCTTEVIEGDDVADAICSAAERVSADMVVLGRHEHSRLRLMMPGTVADEVAVRSRRPVLLVPDSAAL